MITPERLKLHAKWVNGEPDGVRLQAQNANLSGANLSGANLFGANLFGANLIDAILRDASLRGANLSDANLSDANLSGANLFGANLSGANLSGANLFGANLFGANLRGANLSDANLFGANLRGANLSDANLFGANLIDAILSGANLSGAVGLPIADDAPQRLQAVAAAVLDGDGATLAMGNWHTCDTTHCLAGWAIHQAGTIGKTLESLHGPHMAGLLLLGHEAAGHFYDSDKEAIEWLRSVVQKG
jgi:uncharacterized protein YjbI with pentapeptide repeats